MKDATIARLSTALTCAGLFTPRADALPTMIRLGYVNCAACHINPQGGGLLNSYGRGIDQAQSLRGGEYRPSQNRFANALSWGGRITQDLRVVAQQSLSVATGASITGVLRARFMYRNNTELGGGFRFSVVVVGENTAAPRPRLAYDPSVRSAQVYVPTALLSYRPRQTLEFSVGREQLPTGLNLPELGIYVHARNRYGYYDAPTQAKMFWWSGRHTISLYAFAPGGNEPSGFHESGGGVLAEVDVLGNHRTVVGINALRGTSHKLHRTTAAPYARLGFGRWGMFLEYDVTDRTLPGVTDPPPFRQEASYAQVFAAVREWLIPSVGFERLVVHGPYKETLVAPRFELACRLSSNFTLSVGSRLQVNPTNDKVVRTVSVQLAMKTVN